MVNESFILGNLFKSQAREPVFGMKGLDKLNLVRKVMQFLTHYSLQRQTRDRQLSRASSGQCFGLIYNTLLPIHMQCFLLIEHYYTSEAHWSTGKI